MNIAVQARPAVGPGLLVAALGLWLAVAFQRDLSLHRERIATGSRIVETRCGPVEFAETGSVCAARDTECRSA